MNGLPIRTLRTTLKQQVMILVALLYGYWFAMTLLPVPGADGGIGANLLDAPSRTLAAWVDRALLGSHLWINSKTWDPEGPLSTIPAIGTAMLGVMAGRWLGTDRPLMERLSGLFAVGSLAIHATSARRGYRPFLLGASAGVVLVLGKFVFESNWVMYAGFSLLIIAFIWNALPRAKSRACRSASLDSFLKEEKIP